MNIFGPEFDESLKIGSWEHLEQIPTVTLTFIQATFVHMGQSPQNCTASKKGDFLKFCFYSTLKVSNITLMVLVLKSNSWASLFLLTLSVIANYLIMSRRYLLLFF